MHAGHRFARRWRAAVDLRRSRSTSPVAARGDADLQHGEHRRRRYERHRSDAGQQHRQRHDAGDGRARPSITKSDGGASAAPGGTVSYTLTYANSGRPGATGVVLTETVPANTTFNAGASTAGWVSCRTTTRARPARSPSGLAAAGGNQTATFAVTVVNPVPAGTTQISNTASVADDGDERHRPDAGQQHRQRHDAGDRGAGPSRSRRATAARPSRRAERSLHAQLRELRQHRRDGRRADRDRSGEHDVQRGASTAGWAACRTTTPARPARSPSARSPARAAVRPRPFAVTVDRTRARRQRRRSPTPRASPTTATNGAGPDAGQQHRQRYDAGDRGARPLDHEERRRRAATPGRTVAYTLTYANAGDRRRRASC